MTLSPTLNRTLDPTLARLRLNDLLRRSCVRESTAVPHRFCGRPKIWFRLRRLGITIKIGNPPNRNQNHYAELELGGPGEADTPFCFCFTTESHESARKVSELNGPQLWSEPLFASKASKKGLLGHTGRAPHPQSNPNPNPAPNPNPR
jgi:hypothetical protein